MAYAEEVAVYSLRLREEFGDDAVKEAERRMEEAATRSGSDWRKWLHVRDSLIAHVEHLEGVT